MMMMLWRHFCHVHCPPQCQSCLMSHAEVSTNKELLKDLLFCVLLSEQISNSWVGLQRRPLLTVTFPWALIQLCGWKSETERHGREEQSNNADQCWVLAASFAHVQLVRVQVSWPAVKWTRCGRSLRKVDPKHYTRMKCEPHVNSIPHTPRLIGPLWPRPRNRSWFLSSNVEKTTN